jgi:hypothetical protein
MSEELMSLEDVLQESEKQIEENPAILPTSIVISSFCFGYLFRQWRLETMAKHNITLEQFCKHLGMSPKYLETVEKNIRKPLTTTQIRRILKAFPTQGYEKPLLLLAKYSRLADELIKHVGVRVTP